MINKQAELYKLALLYVACKGVLRVKQAGFIKEAGLFSTTKQWIGNKLRGMNNWYNNLSPLKRTLLNTGALATAGLATGGLGLYLAGGLSPALSGAVLGGGARLGALTGLGVSGAQYLYSKLRDRFKKPQQTEQQPNVPTQQVYS